MVREQVLEGGLLIDFVGDFRHSSSTRSVDIPSIKEDEGVLPKFSKSEVAYKPSLRAILLVLPND